MQKNGSLSAEYPSAAPKKTEENMACFVVPAVEAVIVTVAERVIKSKEKEETVKVSFSDGSVGDAVKTPFSKKVGWLNKLLWGGVLLLAFEHIWHGEIIPFFPFFTAVADGNTAEMLAEMATNGVMMSVIVTAVWGVMLAVSAVVEKRAVRSAENDAKEAV